MEVGVVKKKGIKLCFKTLFLILTLCLVLFMRSYLFIYNED